MVNDDCGLGRIDEEEAKDRVLEGPTDHPEDGAGGTKDHPEDEAGGGKDVSREGRVLLFADDLMCTLMRRNYEELELAMKEAHVRLSNFCCSNRLKLNIEKTHHLQLTSAQRLGGNIGIRQILLRNDQID